MQVGARESGTWWSATPNRRRVARCHCSPARARGAVASCALRSSDFFACLGVAKKRLFCGRFEGCGRVGVACSVLLRVQAGRRLAGGGGGLSAGAGCGMLGCWGAGVLEDGGWMLCLRGRERCSAVQCRAVAVQRRTVQYSTVQYSAGQELYSVMQDSTCTVQLQ